MDGVLVNNTPVHIRAFEIFCDRYGVRDWKAKLGNAYGMGNDDIMRLILPEELIRATLTERVPGVTGVVLVERVDEDLVAQAKAILSGKRP